MTLANHHEILRGKFRSLTLVNWNGFFARTFDIDNLVTTLSGGNGAGKSTTMAGFVSALIPDLTLLHFRNTTEAGASGGSRDKGLHGKLKPGVCYAMLEAENSRGQRVFMGVRLQQVAGRDKKVDLKTFSLLNIPASVLPTQLLTEQVNATHARVLPLTDLAEKVASLNGEFKQYNAITDYHSTMFDLGLLPKRLRSSGDRSKFYKLIEASLYGGISSAITRSLRDYLLPENDGVKKAFADMESALRENRMTLQAIKMTQGDRDLFKHLIHETTQYVAADYMRHANERRGNIDNALTLRRELLKAKSDQTLAQQQLVDLSRETAQLTESIATLEEQLQAASDFLNLVKNATRHQEKIERYQEDIELLQARLEEQEGVLESAREEELLSQESLEHLEASIDELRDQLADYQQALDGQQTRALQYAQAMQALQKAQTQCALPSLTAENAADYAEEFQAQLDEMTDALLDLEQKVSVATHSQDKFEQAYQLVCQMAGDVSRDEAWHVAQDLLRDFPSQKIQAQQAPQLRSYLQQLQSRLQQQHQLVQSLKTFNERSGAQVQNAEDLDLFIEEKESLQESLLANAEELNDVRMELRQQEAQFAQKAEIYRNQAPNWLVAQTALEQLQHNAQMTFESSQAVTQFMQQQFEKERDLTLMRDKLDSKRQQLDEQISRLSLPDGAEDPRLTALAERFQGVLLSELYDDVAVEDAPYFSALYGPARHAIVVRDLKAIETDLAELEDCPQDLYFIEGDPSAFDDNSVYSAQETAQGVVVQVSERTLRYSKFPTVPLFGRAARETQREKLEVERDAVQEEYAMLAFDVQKCQRLYQQFSDFVGRHLSLAFEPNPELALENIQRERAEVERELLRVENDYQQCQAQLNKTKEQLAWLQKLAPQMALLEETDLAEQCDVYRENLAQAQDDEIFVRQHGSAIQQLAPLANVLQTDPAKFENVQQEYDRVKDRQKQLQQRVFLLGDVVQRQAHFAYGDAQLTEQSDLYKQLRTQLEQQQTQRENLRQKLRRDQSQVAQYQQVYIGLESALQEKSKMLAELQGEVKELGMRWQETSEEQAQATRDDLQQQLTHSRQRQQFVEKQLTLIESETDTRQRDIRKAQREYQQQRALVVSAKVSWCIVLRLSREAAIEKRLHRRELAYLSSEELRSMSDKALGALRNAVADNEYLRDSLRQSEDNRQPENKVRFFIAVYQHLRERIRQDIVKTDDPIDAIEQMEVELARLTEELTNREKKLAISAESVANIMRKTIQREEHRIRLLNQGLQNIAFGQVQSVRLVVNVRDSHAMLLEALARNDDVNQDLFNDNRLTFSEAMAKLYQRLNPHLEMGQRSPQTIGESLLDYRNYLDLEVEVYRGTDGWLRAESGALSTGEAIGTGMSILLMVVQSWEEESRRIRAKDILPCRLLFLDEAARLDAKSIATLFELCERLDMQLLIAAPENISPEKGTTYKLVRKISGNQEYVHVVGLKGFGAREA